MPLLDKEFTKSRLTNNQLNKKKADGTDYVDLVQFHWWKYEAKHYLAAMEELFILKNEGKIRHVGVTNFDVDLLSEMLSA